MSEERGEIWAKIVAIAWLIAFAVSVTGMLTQCEVDKYWKKQIANHNCAEFYLDGNLDRQWRWK